MNPLHVTILILVLITHTEAYTINEVNIVGESTEIEKLHKRSDATSNTIETSNDDESYSGDSSGDTRQQNVQDPEFNAKADELANSEFNSLESETSMTEAVNDVEKVVKKLKDAGKLKGATELDTALANMKTQASSMDAEFTGRLNNMKKDTTNTFKLGKDQILSEVNENAPRINQHIEEDMGITDQNKRQEMSTKISNQYTKSKFKEYAKKVGKKGLEGVSATSSGLKSFVTGIQNGQWLDIVTGVLGIAAGIAAFFGPVGTLVSIGLTILSTLISVFGSIFGPQEESTEDMIKRILDKALKNAKADELRAEGVGLKKLYGEVSRSISNYRKRNDIEPAQAMKLYNMVFKGVSFFGYLDSYIKRDCKIGEASSYNDDKKKEVLKDQSNRCLEFLNLYCDLSIARQMLMMDLSSFIKDRAKEESVQDRKLLLNKTSNNILKLLSKEQRANMKSLLFLYNPIDFPDNRYIAAKYMSAPEKYPTIGLYMKALDEAYAIGMQEGVIEAPALITAQKLEKRTQLIPNPIPSLFRRMVIYCTETQMQGSCFEFPKIGEYKSSKMRGWNGAIKTVYLSANRKWTGYMGSNLNETQIGPFYGPGMFSLPKQYQTAYSAKIEDTDLDSSNMLKVCEEPDMDMKGECMVYRPTGQYSTLDGRGEAETSKKWDGSKENKHYACLIPFREYDGGPLRDTCIDNTVDDPTSAWCPVKELWGDRVLYKGDPNWDYCYLSNNWDRRIQSFSLPQGLRLYPNSEKGAVSVSATQGNYFYGPLTNTLAEKTWRSMILEVAPDKKTCNDMVKICQGESLSGYCTCLDTPAEKGDPKQYNTALENLQLVNFTEEAKKIKSMRIPSGIQVGVFTNDNDNGLPYGPYKGPITISLLDGAKSSIIKNIKITRLQ